MSEQPRGCTGETCKANGTYVSEYGAKEYYGEGESFRTCPVMGKETSWTRVT
jgi:hypothetical protein